MSINWGIVGTGKIARRFTEDFVDIKNGKILGVASRTQEKSEDFAKNFNIERAYGSYEELAKDKDIDVVYIATPHSMHYENVKLFLNSDKSVLCEKAFTVNGEQLEELINLAKQKELFLMEAMWTYLLPTIKKVQKWIENKEIGDIKFIKSDFGFKAKFDPKSRLFNPKLAGGALLDIGIYPVSISTLLLKGKIKEIKAYGQIGETGVDNGNSIVLKTDLDEIAQLSSSFETNLENNTYIYGTKGKIKIEDFWMTKKAILTKFDDTEEIFLDKSKPLGYNNEAQEVTNCILDKKTESDIITFKRSKQNMKILDEIRKQIGVKYPFE